MPFMGGAKPRVPGGHVGRIWLRGVTWLILSLTILPSLASSEWGPDAEAEEGGWQQERRDPLTGLPSPTFGVKAVTLFPHNEFHALPAGKEVEAMVGVRSEADAVINVTAIAGAVWHSTMPLLIHNLTTAPYRAVVPAGNEITLRYAFSLHPQLPVGDYKVALSLILGDGYELFSTEAFNRTVSVFEKRETFDFELAFIWLFFTCLVAGLSYLGVYLYMTRTGRWPTKRKKQIFEVRKQVQPEKKENKQEERSSRDEWLQGSAIYLEEKKKREGKGKGGRKRRAEKK